MSKIGTLHTHFYLDGLFIVTYHSDKRIGLKSIDTGTMRYIDHRLFLSQYKALSTGISNTWAHTCYIISIHILHSQYCNFSIHPPDSPLTHMLHHQHDTLWASMTHSQHVTLATKLPFHARETYLVPMGDGKFVPTKKIPLGEKLYITMKDQNGQKLTEKNFT